jgi:uncharacterized protein with gpF-like domain
MPKNNWTIFARRTLALEKQLRPKLISLTKDFRSQFISDLQNHGKDAAISNLQQTTIADKLAPTLQYVYKTAGLMGAKMQWEELKQSVKQGQKAGGFGRNEQWIQDVINYLKLHLLKFIQDISETMRQDMINILQKGIDEQLSISEIVKNLQATGLIEARAKVIARTEIVRAANVGHSVAAKSFPYEVNKRWSSAKDHHTRHSHVYINGHVVDENDFFKVPDYKGDKPLGTFSEMLYPGDSEAPAAQTINCRCRVLYQAKRDQAGNLIMRDQTQAPVIPMRRIPSYEPAQIAAILKSNISVTVK